MPAPRRLLTPAALFVTCLAVGHWARCPARSTARHRCVLERGHSHEGCPQPDRPRYLHLDGHGRRWSTPTS